MSNRTIQQATVQCDDYKPAKMNHRRKNILIAEAEAEATGKREAGLESTSQRQLVICLVRVYRPCET
jgi:hypothetical protein